MKRDLSFEDISDGKRYKAQDLAPTGTNDCKGCTECCRVTEDTIFLDPFDIYNLEKATGRTFEEMLETIITLRVSEGLIVPVLMKRAEGPCVFLSAEGRCGIHYHRPGFCRMFPLGRIWNEDGTFDYFLQIHECPRLGGEKVLISDWLGIEHIEAYEGFIRAWKEVSESIKLSTGSNDKALKLANMRLLNEYFIKPYDTKNDFYSQFYSRGI